MNKTILEIKKLKKIYRNNNVRVNLFNNINFSIKSGELVALTGPSGSGKSSLLHMIAMLEKPTSGKILLFKKDIKQINENDRNEIRRNNISIIFQNNNLLSDFTALENVLMPLIIKNINIDIAKKKALKILNEFNLAERQDYFPNDLSGGEQQRIAIARAVISGSNLILADEATGNLDYDTSMDIFSYFKKLKKMNKAIIFATHNRELANRADYKLSILRGNIKRV
jgi:ABC-type antimicrobial peptide transport system, ATPase component